jgi:D-serine dehydratase
MMNLDLIADCHVDGTCKGVPPNLPPTRLADLGSMGWNILRQDVPFPAAVIHERTLQRNSRWMRSFTKASGVSLCPHGKTTMAPQLFKLQLDDGAWGITAATANHVAVYRRFGVERILLANQLIGDSALKFICHSLREHPDFDFYCLVDSRSNLEWLVRRLRDDPIGRPLQVLIEMGMPGGRCGVRDREHAMDLARRVRAAAPWVALRGVEAFEGIVGVTSQEGREQVSRLLDAMEAVVQACDVDGLFDEGEIILTAGGSTHFDEVARRLKDFDLSRERRVVLRSGCYLTHDVNFYGPAYDYIKTRSAALANIDGDLKPALEVWAMVQSTPEKGLAIATLGKRDVSHDCGLPSLNRLVEAGERRMVPMSDQESASDEFLPGIRDARGVGRITALNDQHAYIALEPGRELAVGDMISVGISHPCTTFDKWGLMYLVDDALNVTGAIKTFF